MRCQVGAPLQEVEPGGHVAALVRAAAGCVEALRCSFRQRPGAVVDGAELASVAIRLLEVVTDDLLHLREAIAHLAFEPVREALVKLRAQPLDEAGVCSVADEDMTKPECRLVDEASLGGERELSLHERAQALGDCSDVRLQERSHRAPVERLSFHRRALDGVALRGRQAVEPRRQQPAQARGNGHGRTVLPKQRRQLVHEERVSPRAGDELAIRLGAELAQETFRVIRVQWLETHDAGPVRPSLEQIGSRGGEEEDGDVELGEADEEVEQGRLGPVQVLDREDQRALCRQRADEPAQSPGDVLGSHRAAQPDERRDSRGRLLVDEARHLRPRFLTGVVVVNAGGRPDDLRYRPERDPLSVGQAAAFQHATARAEPQLDVRDEPRLADARLAHDGDKHAPRLGTRALERLFELVHLPLTADERDSRGSRSGHGGDAEETECRERLALPFGFDRCQRLSVDGAAGEAVRELADDDLARGRRLLQPCRDVDGIARRERLLARHLQPPRRC